MNKQRKERTERSEVWLSRFTFLGSFRFFNRHCEVCSPVWRYPTTWSLAAKGLLDFAGAQRYLVMILALFWRKCINPQDIASLTGNWTYMENLVTLSAVTVYASSFEWHSWNLFRVECTFLTCITTSLVESRYCSWPCLKSSPFLGDTEPIVLPKT